MRLPQIVTIRIKCVWRKQIFQWIGKARCSQAPQRGAGGGNAPVSAIRSYTNFRLGTLCWTNRTLLYALCSPVNGRYIARAYMHAPIYKFKWPGHNAQPRHTYSNLILRFYFAWTKSTRPSWSRPDLCLNCLHGAISATIYCARLVRWNQLWCKR